MINEIRTTFNGTSRTYPLADKTLVIGQTGAGKTTLLASLGLLLTGSGDDVAGRAEVASPADLALAMREDQESIEIEAGGVGKLAIQRGKKPTTNVEQNDWLHPVRKLREILQQKPDAVRQDMAELLLGDEPVDVHRLVPPQVADVLPAKLTVGQIAKRVEEEAEALKQIEGKRRKQEAAVEVVGQTLPARPTPEALEAARRAVEDARKRANGLAEARGRHTAAVEERERAITEYNRLAVRAQELADEHGQAKATIADVSIRNVEQEAARAQLAAAKPPREGLLDKEKQRNLDAYLRVIGLAQGNTCPICRTTPVNLDGFKLQINAVVERHEAATRAAEAELAAESAYGSPEPIAYIGRPLEQISAEYHGVVAKAQDLHARIQAMAIPNAPPADDGAWGADTSDEVLQTLQRAEEQWESSNRLRAELLQLQEQAAKQGVVVDELRRLVDNVYKQRTAAAQDGVSKWLPKGYELILVLQSPTGNRMFRLGLKTPEGVVVTNPSGGQRSALMLAMAVYLIEQGRVPVKGDLKPVVMLSEERGFSSVWLGDVMRALADAPCQIVLTSLVKPSGKAPKGWAIVDLDKVGVVSEETRTETQIENGQALPPEA